MIILRDPEPARWRPESICSPAQPDFAKGRAARSLISYRILQDRKRGHSDDILLDLT